MPRLILASQSPRRAALMREAGYVFEQLKPPFDDPPQPASKGRFDPQTLAMDLATQKALSLLDALPAILPQREADPVEVIILSADTICIGVDGSLIGQPRDVEHARSMIRSFADATHDVITGVALIHAVLPVSHENNNGSDNENQCDTNAETDLKQLSRFADIAAVTFGHLTDESLDTYLATNQWQGKAGGYNLFDRQDAGWPISVDPNADPTTVVGLPMRKLKSMLDAWQVL